VVLSGALDSGPGTKKSGNDAWAGGQQTERYKSIYRKRYAILNEEMKNSTSHGSWLFEL